MLQENTLPAAPGAIAGRGRIIVCGGQKGGTGKTTCALNLAVMAARSGRRVLAVDADRQASLSGLLGVRSAGSLPAQVTAVQKTIKLERNASAVQATMGFTRDLKALAESHDAVVVDVGGWDAEDRKNLELRASLLAADLFVIPTKPGQIDLWTLEHVLDVVNVARDQREEVAAMAGFEATPLHVLALFNQVPANPLQKDIALGRDYIQANFPDLPVSRAAISSRSIYSRSVVTGMAAVEMPGIDAKVRTEMLLLYQDVFGESYREIKG